MRGRQASVARSVHQVPGTCPTYDFRSSEQGQSVKEVPGTWLSVKAPMSILMPFSLVGELCYNNQMHSQKDEYNGARSDLVHTLLALNTALPDTEYRHPRVRPRLDRQ